MADKLGCRKKKNAVWSDVEMDIIRHHYVFWGPMYGHLYSYFQAEASVQFF